MRELKKVTVNVANAELYGSEAEYNAYISYLKRLDSENRDGDDVFWSPAEKKSDVLIMRSGRFNGPANETYLEWFAGMAKEKGYDTITIFYGQNKNYYGKGTIIY